MKVNTFKQFMENEILKDSKFSKIENDIISFFVEHPTPNDKDVHTFADKKGIDTHKLEGIIYKLLSSLIHLRGSDTPDSKFDPKELKMGIQIEQEHHEHDMIAKNIAKAHLIELPDYYSRLNNMEKEGKDE